MVWGRSLVHKLFAPWQSPEISNSVDLREFLGQRAAFTSQKCTIEYCRARSGLLWVQLFREAEFLQALEISRWEAFAAILVDIAVLMEGKLRPALGDVPDAHSKSALADALAVLVEDRLNYHPAPRHRPHGWLDVVEAARQRLYEGQRSPPKAAHEIGKAAGRRVFETLPMHPSVRTYDQELVENNVRLNLSRIAADFETRARPDPLLADLLGAGRDRSA